MPTATPRSPAHNSAVTRPSFRDWCSYRVQVATESAVRQVAKFQIGREEGSRSGVWIYASSYNPGIRIGAIESTRVEDGRTRYAYRYTAISRPQLRRHTAQLPRLVLLPRSGRDGIGGPPGREVPDRTRGR